MGYASMLYNGSFFLRMEFLIAIKQFTDINQSIIVIH